MWQVVVQCYPRLAYTPLPCTTGSAAHHPEVIAASHISFERYIRHASFYKGAMPDMQLQRVKVHLFKMLRDVVCFSLPSALLQAHILSKLFCGML